MPELTLEPISEKEIPLLQQLAIATWEPTYKDILSREQLLYMQEEIYNEGSLRTQMQKGQQFYFIREEGKAAGFLSVSHLSTAEGRFKLNKLYVLPELQGRGFGRKAITAAEALVRSQNGKVLELNVNKYNKARDFYERCGYVVIREEDIAIGPYWMNDFVMEKDLV